MALMQDSLPPQGRTPIMAADPATRQPHLGARGGMTVARAVTALAGSMVLLSLALAWFVSPLFLGLTAFVGANLLQSSFTGFCPAASVFRRIGLRETPL